MRDLAWPVIQKVVAYLLRPAWKPVLHPPRYHHYSIKEAPDKFVLTTHSPGEAQEVQETPHAAFRQELKR